jgi:hypothetical protein
LDYSEDELDEPPIIATPQIIIEPQPINEPTAELIIF